MPRRSWRRARPIWCRWRAVSSTIRIGAGTRPRRSAPRWRGRCNMRAPAPSCGRRPPRAAEVENLVFLSVLFASLFVGIAVVMGPYALYRDGRDVIPAMRTYWRRGFAGGALQVLSYGIAIWAMTLAPVSYTHL